MPKIKATFDLNPDDKRSDFDKFCTKPKSPVRTRSTKENIRSEERPGNLYFRVQTNVEDALASTQPTRMRRCIEEVLHSLPTPRLGTRIRNFDIRRYAVVVRCEQVFDYFLSFTLSLCTYTICTLYPHPTLTWRVTQHSLDHCLIL